MSRFQFFYVYSTHTHLRVVWREEVRVAGSYERSALHDGTASFKNFTKKLARCESDLIASGRM